MNRSASPRTHSDEEERGRGIVKLIGAIDRNAEFERRVTTEAKAVT
jgi:hypothetical protein